MSLLVLIGAEPSGAECSEAERSGAEMHLNISVCVHFDSVHFARVEWSTSEVTADGILLEST